MNSEKRPVSSMSAGVNGDRQLPASSTLYHDAPRRGKQAAKNDAAVMAPLPLPSFFV